MSGFSDIARAYAAYSNTRDWGAVDYGLIYTSNAGWLDLGHLDPTSSRRLIGASNLWAAVRGGGAPLLRRNCTIDGRLGALDGGGLAYFALNEWRCNTDEFVRFPDNNRGFVVRYRQDHGGYPGRPGVERHYAVKFQLNSAQQKSVALSIFMDVSRRFEWFQRLAGLNGLITDSGHSQEDFVSNLLGFYIAIGEVTKTEAIRLAHPVSQTTAEAVWRSNGAVGSTKNYQFRPHLLTTGRNDPNLRQCVDECAMQPRQFPAAFQTVQPVEPGPFHVPYAGGPPFRF